MSEAGGASLLQRRRTLTAVTGAVLIAAVGTAFILMPKRSVSTDNAYLQADSAVVAPKVRGLVQEVLVNHNQTVRRGDLLATIDPEEFEARVAAATADLEGAHADIESAKAALASLAAEERLAASNVRAAHIFIRSADAQSELADATQKRYDDLVRTGAVSLLEADQFRTSAVTAQVNAQNSRVAYEVTRDQAAVTAARRAVLQASLAQSIAAASRAEAALNLAKQDLEHTRIRAPIDGVVGDRRIEVGDYVDPGTRLMTVVPLHSIYVIANFKETQTARMTIGQPATIEVDALPGTELSGEVDSFAPGSGSQFSLLPFEPGTGNFTKIVQRVPVRIRFQSNQPSLAHLRPGLSSRVSVRLIDIATTDRKVDDPGSRLSRR